MEGYIASILIGIMLGLMGGGGSILTVPVLVYLFQIDTVLATSYSLFIIGSTSAVGSVSYFRKKLINFKTAFLFGLPSIISIYITRIYILPEIPQILFSIHDFSFTKNIFLMVIFGILMILAAYHMIKKENPKQLIRKSNSHNYFIVILEGLGVGIVTGLIGAGGGFLIIPILVNHFKLNIKEAIGTSLFIIAINSLSGFLFSMGKYEIQWHFIFLITLIAVIGILIGSYFATKIDGKKLKPMLGWFVLIMGVFIILKEIIFT